MNYLEESSQVEILSEHQIGILTATISQDTLLGGGFITNLV